MECVSSFRYKQQIVIGFLIAEKEVLKIYTSIYVMCLDDLQSTGVQSVAGIRKSKSGESELLDGCTLEIFLPTAESLLNN